MEAGGRGHEHSCAEAATGQPDGNSVLYLVINISDVHHILDLVTKIVCKNSSENIKCDIRSGKEGREGEGEGEGRRRERYGRAMPSDL